MAESMKFTVEDVRKALQAMGKLREEGPITVALAEEVAAFMYANFFIKVSGKGEIDRLRVYIRRARVSRENAVILELIEPVLPDLLECKKRAAEFLNVSPDKEGDLGRRINAIVAAHRQKIEAVSHLILT